MSESKLRVAVIGTGMIANAAHIPAWKNLKKDVELVAFADKLGERSELLAKEHGVPKAYDDWRRMLQEVKPDLVSVCSPNSYHKEHTIGALESGAHVLCEKPIATSHADAAAMYAAAKAAGKLLMIGQSARFYNRAQVAKDILDSGKLGQPYFAETWYMRRRGIPTWGQFHMKEHSGGGPVYDLGVHAIDLLFWLLGSPKVKAVSSQTYTKIGNRDEKLWTSLADSGAGEGVLTPRPYDYREFDVEDMAAGYMRLEGDLTIFFKTSWAANVPKGHGHTLILGTEGGLTLDPMVLATNMNGHQIEVTPDVPADAHGVFAGHWGETAHFVRVIKGEEKELIVKPEQVLNVMKALDALYQSSALGHEVIVE